MERSIKSIFILILGLTAVSSTAVNSSNILPTALHYLNAFLEYLSSDIVRPDPDQWWGPEELKTQANDSIIPFRIKFEDTEIDYLKSRLTEHREWTPPLENVTMEYGWNTGNLTSWLTYWAETYPFEEQEEYLNKYLQFTTIIQGLRIHFLKENSTVSDDVDVLPVLLLHGFPGSIREFYETIPELVKNDTERNFTLEIIAPSLPGFGFSDGAVRPGFGAAEMGVVLRNLMHRLGYETFYISAGDVGASIASCICTLYPNEVLGYHTNFAVSLSPITAVFYIIGSIFPSLVVDEAVQDRMYPITTILYWLTRETAYLHIQATKPDTLGVAMTDSPAGQLAYIFQLISMGTRKDNYYKIDGGLDEVYDRNELIDNLMFYWIGKAFTTATRFYAETISLRVWEQGILKKPTSVPTCTIHAKNDIIYMSPLLLKCKFTNLLNSTVLDGAGHFLALEEPKIYANDALQCFENIRAWRKNNN